MPSDQVRKIIEERLESNWLLTAIGWHDSGYVPTRGISFVEPVISGVGSEVIGINCDRHFFLGVINVHTPSQKGAGQNMKYCDSLINLFRGYREGGFRVKQIHSEAFSISNQWHTRKVVMQCNLDYVYA